MPTHLESFIQSGVAFLPLYLLVFLRVSVVMVALPPPLGSVAPVQLRVVLALLIALALALPRILAPLPPAVAALSPGALGVAAAGEFVVGAVIGLTVRVTLAAADVAGAIMGLSMGQGFAQTFDPSSGEQSPPVGRFLNALAVLLFFVLSGHHVMLRALAFSFDHAPTGRAVSAVMHDGLLRIGADLVAQGLRIASPVLGAMFLVQVGMGMVARSAPRVQVFALTFAVTSVVGTVVLLLSAPSIVEALAHQIGRLPEALGDALGGG